MPNKTIAELKQELKDAGRDVRMAGEMVERACGGMQDWLLIREARTALSEAHFRVCDALDELARAEAAK